jgi:hypothetical protein
MNLGGPVTLFLIVASAFAGIGGLTYVERRIGRFRWIDRAAGVLGLAIFAALVMLAGRHMVTTADPTYSAWVWERVR